VTALTASGGPIGPILVDSNVILDVATNDPRWGAWSTEQLAQAAEWSTLVINSTS
jgi:hypothetical protein